MRTLTFLAVCFCASPSLAQVYIGAAAGSDTALVTSFETAGASQLDRGGTSPAVAVRAGIALGQRWGAEVEVARAFTIEHTNTTDGGILASGGLLNIPSTVISGDFFPIRFTPTLRTDTEQQLTAVNALAWVSYPLSGRIDLVLAAGAAFNRTVVEQRVRIESVTLPGIPGLPAGFPGLPLDLFASSTRVVNYDVGPVVGVETRIALGDRLRVVPAVRMSTAFGGWSVRPTAGIAWMF